MISCAQTPLRRLLSAIALVAAVASPASAQSDDSLWNACHPARITYDNAESVVTACTTVIRVQRPRNQVLAEVLLSRGRAYLELERNLEARDDLRQAYGLVGGDRLDITWSLGDAEYATGNKEYAFTFWNKAFSVAQEVGSTLFVLAVEGRGEDYLRRRQFDEAIRDLTFAVEHRAAFSGVSAVRLLARAYSRSGRADEAERFLTSWVKGHRLAAVERAIVRYELRRFKDALADLDSVPEITAKDGVALFVHGAALLELFNTSQPAMPDSVWYQAKDEMARGRQLDADGVKELLRDDIMLPANFDQPPMRAAQPAPAADLPAAGPPATPPSASAVPTPIGQSRTANAADPSVSPAPVGTLRPVADETRFLLPIGAAALIGLAVLGWKLSRRRRISRAIGK